MCFLLRYAIMLRYATLCYQVNPVTPTDTSPFTSVDALHAHSPSTHLGHGMLGAHKPLIVPMLLKISQLRLRAIITLVVDRSKGVTLAFKTDPVESVAVHSTFDDLLAVKKMLQMEIEKQLRAVVVDEIPAVVHRLSLERMGLREQTVEEALHRTSSSAVERNLSSPVSATSVAEAGRVSSPLSTKDDDGVAAAAESHDSGLGPSMDSLESLTRQQERRRSSGAFRSLPSSPVVARRPPAAPAAAAPARDQKPEGTTQREAPRPRRLGSMSPTKQQPRDLLFSSLPALVAGQGRAKSVASSPADISQSTPAIKRPTRLHRIVTTKSPQSGTANVLAVPSSTALSSLTKTNDGMLVSVSSPPPRRPLSLSTNALHVPTSPGMASLLHHRQTAAHSDVMEVYRPARRIVSRFNDARFVDTEMRALSTASTSDLRQRAGGESSAITGGGSGGHGGNSKRGDVPVIRRTSSHSASVLFDPRAIDEELEVEQRSRRVLETGDGKATTESRKTWVWMVGS